MTIQILAICSGFLLFGGFLVWSSKGLEEKKAEMHSVFGRIFVSACQVNMLALSFHFDFGDLLKGVLSSTEEVASIGTSYFDVACVISKDASSFVWTSWGLMILPLILVTLVALILYMLPKVQEPSTDDSKSSNEMTTFDMTVALATTVLFFFHPTLVSQCAYLFDCKKMGDDDFRLRADLDIVCFER